MSDLLRIGNHTFGSRLIIGTGKYKDVDETRRALEASGAELITVALRRIDLNDRGKGSLMALLTEEGRRFERTVEGFHARVVQHECDHLDGVLYPMRIRDFTRFGFNEALFPGQALGSED